MMKKHSLHISLILVFALLMGSTAMAAESADISLTQGDVYSFTPNDFLAADGISGIVVTHVPASCFGSVQLGSRSIQAGDVLPASQLEHLTFLSEADADGDAVISCLRVMSDGSGEEYAMTLHINSSKNEAPVAEDSEFETYKNISGEVPLNVSDAENDPLTVNIVTSPKRGEVTVYEDGKVVYTPKENKVGKDSFTFTVTDSAGNTSGEATVRIQIKKPSDKETFADMAGDEDLLAATWMRESGIYGGVTVSGNLLFQPDRPITRGEFVAMCVSMTDSLEEETLSTGFMDESSTPQWLQPYAAAALKCGYITGSATESGVFLNADQEMNHGEAAVMLQNMLSLPSAETEAVIAADNSIPVWAAGAVSAVQEAGLFDATDTANTLTYREAAQILYKAHLMADSQDNTLLTWARK